MKYNSVTLGDVCKVIAGQSPDGKNYNQEGHGFPFYQGKKEFGSVFIKPPTVWTTQVTKEAIKNDILMSVRAPVGPVNIATENICIGRGLAAIRTTEKINHEYLFKYLLKIEDELIGNTGAVFNSINKTQIENLRIPLPPIPIQKEIALKLDAIFAEIDKAIQATESNIKNTEALFQSYLTKKFVSDRNTYTSTTLGNYYDVRDGTHDSPKFYDSGYPLVTSKNLKNGEINFENIQYICKEDYLNISLRSGVKKGDVLMAMIGTIGNPVIVETESEFAIKNIALFKLNDNQSSHFLRYYLSSDYVINKMEKDAKGATQKFVGLGYLRSFPISIPSLDIQMRIVNELEEHEKYTKILLSSYSFRLDNLLKLKQSILQQVFSCLSIGEHN